MVVVLASLLDGSAALAEVPDSWSSQTSMIDGDRNDQTQTLLPNSKVLVTGGFLIYAVDTAKATAELYDPASNRWTLAAPMSTPRYDHTATLLGDGRVLVAGGYGPGSYIASSELYDPATNKWTTAAPMHRSRERHTATLLPSGKVLVSGGNGDDEVFSSTSEVYDPRTNRWSAPVAMTGTRKSGSTATLLPSGEVLAAGGHDLWHGTADDSAELYDPATDAWSGAATMSVAREHHIAAPLPDGKVLVAGGSAYNTTGSAIYATAELYDRATNTWTPAGSMGTSRYEHAAASLSSGKVLVTGGNSGFGAAIGGGAPPLASTELYDPAANAWTPTASMRTPRDNHSATLLTDGSVLVSGGEGVDNSERYGRTSLAPGPGPGGGTGPPGPGATPVTRARIGSGKPGSVRAGATGRILLPRPLITCPADPPACKVTVTARARLHPKARSRKLASRTTLIGSATFSVSPGKRLAPRFVLGRRGRTALRRLKHMRATVTIVARHATQVVTRTITVALRARSR